MRLIPFTILTLTLLANTACSRITGFTNTYDEVEPAFEDTGQDLDDTGSNVPASPTVWTIEDGLFDDDALIAGYFVVDAAGENVTDFEICVGDTNREDWEQNEDWGPSVYDPDDEHSAYWSDYFSGYVFRGEYIGPASNGWRSLRLYTALNVTDADEADVEGIECKNCGGVREFTATLVRIDREPAPMQDSDGDGVMDPCE